MANKVTFQKPPEPTFLAQFKQKVGYKETAALSDKFGTKRAPGDEGNVSDEDDETKFLSEERKDGDGPVVVKLKKNDMTEEEARIYAEFTRRKRKSDTKSQSTEEPQAMKARTDEEDKLEAEGKIVYRKPNKETDDKKRVRTKSKKREKSGSSKAIQNRSLLSFDQQEQEELDP